MQILQREFGEAWPHEGGEQAVVERREIKPREVLETLHETTHKTAAWKHFIKERREIKPRKVLETLHESMEAFYKGHSESSY